MVKLILRIIYTNVRRSSNFLSFRPDRSLQTLQTQIRLRLEGQSDQDLPHLPFPLFLNFR